MKNLLAELSGESDFESALISEEIVKVSWFPRNLGEMSDYGVNLLKVGDTVNEDHIGFKD